MNTSALLLTVILVLMVLNTIILKPKSRILSEVPSKILLYTLVSVLITDAVVERDLAIGNLEIAILLIMFMSLELVLLLFQRFASDSQVKQFEQVMDFNKSIRQKFQDRPVFMAIYSLLLVVVVLAIWVF